MKNGDSIIFYSRTAPGSTFADRLQVWLNPSNNSVTVGNTAISTGDFTNKMLDINPTYATGTAPGAYPEDWTKYSIVLSGLPNAPVKRRFAFRYFVEDGGPTGSRSYGVGIDNVSFRSK